MQEEKDIMTDPGEEKEIDLLELAAKLWAKKKNLAVWSLCGAIVGLIVAFSIPKEYTTTVKLAPEVTDGKGGGGGLGALASMAGLGSMQSSADAVYPQLYPEVVSSVPFATSLFDVQLKTKGKKDREGETYTLREYLQEKTRGPWWSAVIGAPFKLLALLRSSDDDEKNAVVNTFALTPEENQLVEALNLRVSADVDAKTNVVSLTVKMQDPLVSAMLADTVVARLQEYVTDYRTNKSRKDLEYAEKLNEEAKAVYYQTQQKYAEYQDRNQGIALQSVQITKDRLQNETELAFNLYNQTAQQVQKAKAKVQETTPVYAVINPATVPVKPSSPKKAMILIGFTFLAFVACAAWILFLQPLVGEFRAKKAAENTDEKGGKES